MAHTGFGSPPSGFATWQSNLSSLFNWNPSSLVGKKKRQALVVEGRSYPLRLIRLCGSKDTLPDGQERTELQISGLGEKRITLCAYADAQYEFTYKFPKLTDSGGFELMRVPESGKLLDVIASPANQYTFSYLRAVIHHAKIYIRPLYRKICHWRHSKNWFVVESLAITLYSNTYLKMCSVTVTLPNKSVSSVVRSWHSLL